MKLSLEATGTIQTINGVPARLWTGRTESGIAVRCWIALIEVKASDDNTAFERELREVKTERQLVSFDYRLVM